MEATTSTRSEQPPIAGTKEFSRQFPSLARSYRRADVSRALAEAIADLPPPREVDPAAAFADLERLTTSFRETRARKHVDRVREETARYHLALATWEAIVGGRASAIERVELGEIDGTSDRMTTWHAHQQRARDVFGDACSSPTPRGGAIAGQWPYARDEDDDDDRDPDELVTVMREALNARKWHAGRERGQRERFERVRACGSRVLIAHCSECNMGMGKDGSDRAIPEGCGVRRVCQRCDAFGARNRRARFGGARGRVFVDAHRFGLRRKFREGGRYTEKMLTLTIPHVALEDCSGEVRERSSSTLQARIEGVWLAWPKFWRRVMQHLKKRGERWITQHRAFEWTPSIDGTGHPHFHVYLFSPFIDVREIRRWWAAALRKVGVPVETRACTGCKGGKRFKRPCERCSARGCRHRGCRSCAGRGWRVVRCEECAGSGVADVCIVHLKMLREFDLKAVRELMKDQRGALKLSSVTLRDDGPGVDAFSYADGWTLGDVEAFCSPDVRARLYCALEGKRLSQASRGFFLDDEPCVCGNCGSTRWRVVFETAPIEGPSIGFAVAPPTGPPS